VTARRAPRGAGPAGPKETGPKTPVTSTDDVTNVSATSSTAPAGARTVRGAVPGPRRSKSTRTKPAETKTKSAGPVSGNPGPEDPEGTDASDANRWPLLTNGRKEFIAFESSALLVNRVHADTMFTVGEVQDGNWNTIIGPNGEPLTVTGFWQNPKPYASVLYEGRIRVTDSLLAFEITPDRVIDATTGSRSYVVETISKTGVIRRSTIASAITRKAQATEWLDALNLTSVQSVAMIGKYIRSCADLLGDSDAALYGQGPVYLPDGTLALATPSGVYDTAGQSVPGWRVDMSTVNPAYLRGMHDVAAETDPDAVTRGLGLLLDVLGMSETHPEVPAAHLGQLFIAVLAPLDARYFTVIWLHGKRGCGKTRFEALISAIQSAVLRDLANVRPELNLGDSTGTTKGPKYRVPMFGLGSILGDDVFKAVDSALTKTQRTEMADALIRSKEAGAAAIGTVDKVRNLVTSKASGQLCASIRFTAEEAPPTRGGMESSTADRMIIQGGWQTPWYEVFDQETTARVSESASLDAMFAAYSEITMWVWQNQDVVARLHDDASEITAGWTMGSDRVKDRYTPVVTGLLVLRERAVKYGFPASCVDAAIEALRVAAEAQTAPEKKINIPDEVRRELRLALKDGNVAGVGRPVRAVSEDQTAYISPYLIKPDPDDEDAQIWEWPTGVHDGSDLGLRRDNAHYRPRRDAAVELYVRPPQQTPQGGRNRATQHQWSLIVPTADGTLESLCRMLTRRRERIDGFVFEPAQVLAAFEGETDGPTKTRIRYYAKPSDNGVGTEDKDANPATVLLIPTEWLFRNDDEGED
jgi:hypothetical protein